jgi:putative hydroxymethylpyrimidine transport system substrate-binding protein
MAQPQFAMSRRRKKKKSRRLWRRSKLWLWLGIPVAAGILGLTLLAQPQDIARTILAKPSSPVSYVVKLNGPVIPSAAGLVIAAANGLFQRNELNIVLQPGSSDLEALAATDNDNVISVATASSFLVARASGRQIVAFAAAYTSSSVEFYHLSTTPVQAPRDFEDRSIGYPENPDVAFTVDTFVSRNDIASSRLAVKHGAASISDLLNGNIDILAGRWDIEGAALHAAGADFRSLSPESFGIHVPGTVYVVNERVLATQRSSLVKFLVAVSAGWEATYADIPRSSAIILDFTGSPGNKEEVAYLLDRQRRLLRRLDGRFGEMEISRWRGLQTLLLQQRLLPHAIDLGIAVNFDILKDANRVSFPVETGTRTQVK